MKNAKKTVVTSRFLPNVIITRDGGKLAQFFPYTSSIHAFNYTFNVKVYVFDRAEKPNYFHHH